MNHFRLGPALFWLLVGLLLLLALWQAVPRWLSVPAGEAKPRPVTARGDLAEDEKTTIAIFEQAKDSVVYISTRATVMDVFTRNVFTVPRGTGHVITNYHVIEGASEAMVRLADGRSFRAALVGASPPHDIAVLRIGVAFKRPPPVPVGTSHDLKVGQKVFAIGNPFGLDWTLTTGIVSALDRSLGTEDGRTIDHLIQTDAAINPGNSGGPLLDSAGRLIGINTAIYSPSGASAGIGFAVPVDTVNRVVPQLIAHGRYLRPALGVEVDEALNARLTRLLGVEGVVILRVLPDSGAAQAGLAGVKIGPNGALVPGDVILAVDGKPTRNVAELFSRLDDHQVGDAVVVRIWRDGRVMERTVTLMAGS
jgi:S1-C subfamily serine protease